MADFIEDAIASAGVTLIADPFGEDRYKCRLKSLKGEMVRDVKVKPGLPAPSAANLIYHFAMMAQEIEDSDDITDWADEYGKALSAPGIVAEYQQKERDHRDLAILLGEATFSSLLMGLEISQAIGKAMPR